MRMLKILMLILPLLIAMPSFAEDVKSDVAVPQVSKLELVEAKAVEVALPDIGHGKAIFDSVCIHCHRTDYESSSVGAPGLKGVFERHDADWIHTWISGPEAFSKTNSDAKDLIGSNPYGLIMPTLPEMQIEKNRKDIMEYLKSL